MKNIRKLLLPVIIVLLLTAFNFLSGDKTDPASIGIIGGADGPTQVILKGKTKAEAQKGSKKTNKKDDKKDEEPELDEDGVYDSKDDVALYIRTFGHLPSNYITKKEAKAEGWEGGSLERYCPGMCIGGDYFGNFEGLLPKAKGRKYTECDIDTLGAKSRGAKRIIFSNDGLIYYTDDHYESYTLLYGEP